ncbi:MAG: hypothetical protein HN617_16960 [Planctomycetaceae bacterium]|jgi:hypothetical protein|nr:hypothetical protein [Planctomycetaceae bacterium]MBT4845337.1 hypothetical protein [Planctomycetaceae bacterium]MBT5124578.1 hypothetical protein [Planctomycetaceae bacterium]MBT5598574.1 hypothetical protein [Planctomycetaceae bacterium]MBT5885890.1 hypothetical protein [Planctomycetaceae bacterium]
MLRYSEKQLQRVEANYAGVRESIERYEAMDIPACPSCSSDDTALIQVGLIGRTMAIAGGTTKFKLIPNRSKPKWNKMYFCRACEETFGSREENMPSD